MNLSYFQERSIPVTESGCWLWERAIKSNGYGVLTIDNKIKHAHRLAYESLVGEIPSGMCVCHRCDVRSCVNPAHLFLGTQKDNLRDMVAKGRVQRWQAEKTHCPHGHPYDEENTGRWGKKRARMCRTCVRERNRKRRAAL